MEYIMIGRRVIFYFFLTTGGVEHQRFQLEPGKSCKWIAFLYVPYRDSGASEVI